MVKVTASALQSHFTDFETAFPTEDARHDAAFQLAGPSQLVPEVTHMSRNMIAAHWGDDMDQRRTLSDLIHDFKDSIESNLLAPVLVVKAGDLEDVLVAGNDRLQHPVELDWGIVSGDELTHGFAGNVSSRGRSRMGVKPPHLGFGIRIPIKKHHTISADVLGDCSVEPKEPTESLVPVYVGTVTLDRNVDYRTHRKIDQRVVAFGRILCTNLLERLQQKTTDEKALEALARLSLKGAYYPI